MKFIWVSWDSLLALCWKAAVSAEKHPLQRMVEETPVWSLNWKGISFSQLKFWLITYVVLSKLTTFWKSLLISIRILRRKAESNESCFKRKHSVTLTYFAWFLRLMPESTQENLLWPCEVKMGLRWKISFFDFRFRMKTFFDDETKCCPGAANSVLVLTLPLLAQKFWDVPTGLCRATSNTAGWSRALNIVWSFLLVQL